MKRFLVLYTAPISAQEQMLKATPEQAKAGMDAWTSWANKAGLAIVDLGSPLGQPIEIGVGSGKGFNAVGYSILRADSEDALRELLREHPHGKIAGFSIVAFESLPMPGESARRPEVAA